MLYEYYDGEWALWIEIIAYGFVSSVTDWIY